MNLHMVPPICCLTHSLDRFWRTEIPDFFDALVKHVANYYVVQMRDFERGELRDYTPCNFSNIEDAVNAIAIVHAGFVLIHPFREGNGRFARLLSGLMALQADFPLLNFESIKGKTKNAYILAVQAGMDKNYEPMKEIFGLVIEKTIALYARNRKRND